MYFLKGFFKRTSILKCCIEFRHCNLWIASPGWICLEVQTNRHDRNPLFRPSLTVMTSGEVYCMIGFRNILGGFDPFEKVLVKLDRFPIFGVKIKNFQQKTQSSHMFGWFWTHSHRYIRLGTESSWNHPVESFGRCDAFTVVKKSWKSQWRASCLQGGKMLKRRRETFMSWRNQGRWVITITNLERLESCKLATLHLLFLP